MSGGENVRPVRAELALLDLYDEALPQVYGYLLAMFLIQLYMSIERGWWSL